MRTEKLWIWLSDLFCDSHYAHPTYILNYSKILYSIHEDWGIECLKVSTSMVFQRSDYIVQPKSYVHYQLVGVALLYQIFLILINIFFFFSTEESQWSTTPSCSRHQSVTDAGVSDGRSNWVSVTTTLFWAVAPWEDSSRKT